MAGRELELASRAAELTQRLEGLGPSIEQRVRESLAAQGIPEKGPGRGRAGPQQARVRPGPALFLAGFVVLVVFAALVAIVYLILQAV
jgi:hypothetical protein